MFETLPCSIRELRLRLRATQREMAEAMCVNLKNYQDMEAGWYKLKPVHVRAALFAAVIIRSRHSEDANLLLEFTEIIEKATRDGGGKSNIQPAREQF